MTSFATAVVAAVLASLLTALVLRSLTVTQDFTRNDRRIDALNEDLARRVRDAIRNKEVAMRRIRNEEDAYAGSTLNSFAMEIGRFREQWRNEASRTLRLFWATVDSEGRLHEVLRRRRGTRPGLALPADVLERLERSRELRQRPFSGVMVTLQDDPARAELEPVIAEFEVGGRVAFLIANSSRGTP